jgi:O-antigen/teichoic acid export membrane protein
MLLTAVHGAVFVEPIAVVGAKEFKGNRFAYLRSAELFHCSCWLALSVVGLSLIWALTGHLGLASAVATMVVASFPIFLASVWRRGCYMGNDPAGAFLGGAAYLVVVILGLLVVRRTGSEAAGSPFIIMAAGSLVALLLTRRRNFENSERMRLRPVAVRHWQYGRWVALSGGTVWLAEMAYPVLIGLNLGAEPAGAFRATELLMMPLYQTLAALTLLIQPWLSGRFAVRGAGFLDSFVPKAALCVLGVSSVYAVLLAGAGHALVPKLYPPKLAAAVIVTLVPLSGWLILRCLHDAVLIPCLRAMEQTRVIFCASLIGAVITVCFGTLVISRWGLPGAAFARASGTLVQLGVLYIGYRGATRGSIG